MTTPPNRPPHKHPERDSFDYASAAEEINPHPAPEREEDPPIPLELVMKPAPAVSQTLILTVVLLLLTIMALGGVQRWLKTRALRADTPEGRAMASLDALGAAQRAYADRSVERRFASFSELRDSPFLSNDYRRANGVPGYSIAFWGTQPPLWTNSGINPASIAPGQPLRTRRQVRTATFTIVAVPLQGSTRGLRTFALCQDGQIRFAASKVNNFEDACAWPIAK